MAGSLEGLLRDLIRAELRTFGETLRQAWLDDLRKAVSLPPTGRESDCQFVSVQRAAEISDHSPQTIRRWIQRGELRSHSRTRHIKIHLGELKALLSQPRGKLGEVVDLEAKARSAIARAHLPKRRLP